MYRGPQPDALRSWVRGLQRKSSATGALGGSAQLLPAAAQSCAGCRVGAEASSKKRGGKGLSSLGLPESAREAKPGFFVFVQLRTTGLRSAES